MNKIKIKSYSPEYQYLDIPNDEKAIDFIKNLKFELNRDNLGDLYYMVDRQNKQIAFKELHFYFLKNFEKKYIECLKTMKGDNYVSDYLTHIEFASFLYSFLSFTEPKETILHNILKNSYDKLKYNIITTIFDENNYNTMDKLSQEELFIFLKYLKISDIDKLNYLKDNETFYVLLQKIIKDIELDDRIMIIIKQMVIFYCHDKKIKDNILQKFQNKFNLERKLDLEKYYAIKFNIDKLVDEKDIKFSGNKYNIIASTSFETTLRSLTFIYNIINNVSKCKLIDELIIIIDSNGDITNQDDINYRFYNLKNRIDECSKNNDIICMLLSFDDKTENFFGDSNHSMLLIVINNKIYLYDSNAETRYTWVNIIINHINILNKYLTTTLTFVNLNDEQVCKKENIVIKKMQRNEGYCKMWSLYFLILLFKYKNVKDTYDNVHLININNKIYNLDKEEDIITLYNKQNKEKGDNMKYIDFRDKLLISRQYILLDMMYNDIIN